MPLWVKLTAAALLTAGNSVGGWRIVKTVGRGIYRLRPLDGLVSQGGSAVVIFAAAAVDAPVSITHVVSASVVGVGTQRHVRLVRWAVVGEMASGWCVTLPVTTLPHGGSWCETAKGVVSAPNSRRVALLTSQGNTGCDAVTVVTQ